MTPRRTLGFLAVYHLVQNTFLRTRGYVAGNLVATAIGLVWARRSDLSLESMGMCRADAGKGLRVGAAAAAATAGLAIVVRDHNAVQGMLDDRRLAAVSDREIWYRLLVRFPLGTALFEEIWFRGILPASLRDHGASKPELVSAAAFTAWHLIPTASTIDANRAGRDLGPGRKVVLVVGGSIVAGVGGLAFAALRRVSGSLAAPLVSHAAVNGISFWMAVRHRRSS